MGRLTSGEVAILSRWRDGIVTRTPYQFSLRKQCAASDVLPRQRLGITLRFAIKDCLSVGSSNSALLYSSIVQWACLQGRFGPFNPVSALFEDL